MNPFPKVPKASSEEALNQQQLMEILKSNPELMKQYQEELTKMQAASTNKGKSYQPLTSKQYAELLHKNQIVGMLDEEGGLIILPEKGLVVKFLDKRTGEKIFVNIVKHEAVDHPEQKQLVDFQNQAGLRIPMSLGRVREDFDKKGVACKVVDVVMNTKIVETAQKNQDIFGFMCQIIGNYLLEKYKIAVSEEKMIKVNLKYKGSTVEIQRIRAKKSANIQDVTQNSDPKSKEQEELEQKMLNELSGYGEKKVIRPEFLIYCYDGNNQKEEYSYESKLAAVKAEIQFELPHLIHSKGIHLEGSSSYVYLLVRGIYQICLKLPITATKFHATFSKKDRKLKLLCSADQTLSAQHHQHKQNKVVQVEFQNDLLEELV